MPTRPLGLSLPPTSPPPLLSHRQPLFRNHSDNNNNVISSVANNNNNHNNNQAAMDRVLCTLHQQLSTAALRRTTYTGRNITESLLLILAVCTFGALLISHINFVHYSSSSNINSHNNNNNINNNIHNNHQRPKIPATCLSSIPGFDPQADVIHIALYSGEQSRIVNPDSDDYVPLTRRRKSACSTGVLYSNLCFTSAPGQQQQQQHDQNIVKTDSDHNGNDHSNNSNILHFYSFSRVKGYLHIPIESYQQLNISMQYVQIAKSDARCFGEPFLQRLVFNYLGCSETVVTNWLVALHNTGFIYNPQTDTIVDIKHSLTVQTLTSLVVDRRLSSSSSAPYTHISTASSSLYWWSKLTVILKTCFLYFITTTLVSFTLRETQERMLRFTQQLNDRVRSSEPVRDLVTAHLSENLVFCPVMVGIIFFLIEFYRGDKIMAFIVLSMVWLCEVFCVLSLRSPQSIHFFPRIFFLLFSLFHFYIFSFPFGFSYTALASTLFFILHSMLFFCNRFELPAVAQTLVNINNNNNHNNNNTRQPNQPQAMRSRAQSAPTVGPLYTPHLPRVHLAPRPGVNLRSSHTSAMTTTTNIGRLSSFDDSSHGLPEQVILRMS